MIKIVLTSNCEYGENGAVIQVKNNDAHSLIERRVAKLYTDKVIEPRVYKTKVMKPRTYKRRSTSPILRSTK